MLECTIGEALDLVVGAEKQSILEALGKAGHRADHIASTSFTSLDVDELKEQLNARLRGIVTNAINLASSSGVVLKPFPLIHPKF